MAEMISFHLDVVSAEGKLFSRSRANCSGIRLRR